MRRRPKQLRKVNALSRHLARKQKALSRRSWLSLEQLEHRLVLSTLRVASWNVFDRPNSTAQDADFETIFAAIGNETVQGVTRPIDIMTMAETDAVNSDRIENILDGLYPTSNFEYQLASADFGGDRTGFIYDTSTVQLVSSQQIASGLTHPSLRGQFRPVGTTGEFDFYVYSIHLKAFGSASDMDQREQEVQTLRQNADALGEGANIIMAGDFNLTGGSAEAAWSEAVAAGPGQLSDAADSPGQWNNNAAFKHLHSWNSDDLRSRLDLHFFSDELEDGAGLEYVQGSFRPFGNNGSHTFSQSITTGNGAAPNVLAALTDASDHLPLVSDYEFAVAEVVLEESGGGTAVAEGDATDSYTLVLASPPAQNVTIDVLPDGQVDLGAGPGSPISLTFTPSNALTPQTITVSAFDDLDAEGTHVSTITHTTSSTDSNFDGLEVANVNVTIFDDDQTASIVINELDSDTSGIDALEFVELYDGGVGNMSLDGLSLVFFAGSTDSSYLTLDLDGLSTNAAGFFVAGNSSVSNVDLVIPNNSIRNGADAVGLYAADDQDFPNGTSVTTTDLIDAVIHETGDGEDAGLLVLLNPGQPQADESQNGNRTGHSVARVPDGGVARNTDTYVAQSPTPGTTNAPSVGGVDVNTIDGLISVSESGTDDTYEISLISLPSVNVIITLDPDTNLDLGAGPGSPVNLTYSSSNALLPQTVTVMANDDTIVEGQHNGFIAYTVTSGDTAYDGLAIPNTTVQITDNDQPLFVINEVDADTFSTDALEFVEIYDGGEGNVSLDGLSLVFFNGNGDVQYAGFDLNGFSTNAEGFFVLGNSAVANVDLVIDNNTIQNGADAVALYLGSAASFPNVTTTDLIDAVVYDTDDGDDSGLLQLLNPGQPQLNERASGDGAGHSNSRVPDGGIARNTDTYVAQDPTPGTFNSDPPPMVDGDFNNDGDYDCDDVDALVAEIAATTNTPAFDLNQNGTVDGVDLDLWLAEAGAANLASGNAYLLGDADLNGNVDGNDFLVWNANKFTSTAAWCDGDFNADGSVDGADFLLWNANKFQSADRVVVTDGETEVDSLHEVQPRRVPASPEANPPIYVATTTVVAQRTELSDHRSSRRSREATGDFVFAMFAEQSL